MRGTIPVVAALLLCAPARGARAQGPGLGIELRLAQEQFELDRDALESDRAAARGACRVGEPESAACAAVRARSARDRRRLRTDLSELERLRGRSKRRVWNAPVARQAALSGGLA